MSQLGFCSPGIRPNTHQVRMVSDPKCYHPKIAHHLHMATSSQYMSDMYRDDVLR